MDHSGHNHLPPELHHHDHDHDVRPRWLPLVLGLLVILAAALALLNRERFLVSTESENETKTVVETIEPAPTPEPVVETPPAPKPVVTAPVKPAPKPVAPAPAKTVTASATGLKLSAVPSPNGTNLTWTATAMNNFAGYKIVRSSDNPNLAYPPDGYIRYHTDRSNTSYLDTGAVPGKSYYYRICAVSTDKQVSCGNVIEVVGD